MRKLVYTCYFLSLLFMPYESEAQFFKKIGNFFKNAVNSVANKADCWFSTAPCDGGFMSCKIKIDNGGGNYTGGWARKKYPMTVFNTQDDISVDQEISNIKYKIEKVANNPQGSYPDVEKYYYNVYQKIYNNASTILDPTNCPAKTTSICEASRVAKNAAFVNLVNFDTVGAPLQFRQGYKDKAIQILEQFNTSIPINASIINGQPRNVTSLIEHSKSLVHYLQGLLYF